MFDRLVSLLLIAAVIACPMWCDNGVCGCCAADECGMEEATNLCPVNESATCCCDESHEKEDRDVPFHDVSNCQGVCGGAVFEKPCQLDDADASVFLPLLDTDESIGILFARIREVGVEHHYCSTSRNHGRFMRTLNSSFLC